MRANNLILTLLFVVLSVTAFCQNKSSKVEVTPVMAKKISLYCRNNPRMLSLFSMSNAQVVQNRRDVADRILSELDKHLDYAENFIADLYYNYGTEMSYFALKNAGFTIKEHDIADAIWKKAQEKSNQLEKVRQAEQANKELAKEKETFELANKGGIFSFERLTKTPEITLDVVNMARFIDGLRIDTLISWNEVIDCSFACIVSKDKELQLFTPVDSTAFSATQKHIWGYIKSNVIVQNPAMMRFEQLDTVLTVPAKVDLQICQDCQRYRSEISFNATKDKKTQRWIITNPAELKQSLNRLDKTNAEAIYMDIESDLYYNPYFAQFDKGKYLIKSEIVENKLQYFINGKSQEKASMSYSFNFKCEKQTFLDRIYQAP